MTAKSIAALSLLAVLAALAVACGAAGSGMRVDKGLAAIAASNPASVQGASGGGGQAGASASLVGTNASAMAAAQPAGAGQLGKSLASGAMAYPAPAGGELAALQQAGPPGIVVQGFGRAAAPADTARVQFVVDRSGLFYEQFYRLQPSPVPSQGVYPTPFPSPTPVTKDDLKPLLDAIKAQGVSDSDIEVRAYPTGYYAEPNRPQSGRVTVTLHNPSQTGDLINAANQAVSESGTTSIQNVGVTYSVNDCDALLTEARKAAVEDARDNGAGLAEALGVGLGDIQGATEYSYDPYGYSSCQPQSGPVYYQYEGSPFDPAQPAEVQIVSNVTISFAMQ